MKQVAVYTRMGPEGRISRLNDFNRRLNSEERSRNVFNEWGLNLNAQLVHVPGRILNNETIIFGDGRTATTNQDADWTRDLRSNPFFMSKKLARWYVIVPARLEQTANQFISLLNDAARGMRFEISQPRL